jgi:hypothetical protein
MLSALHGFLLTFLLQFNPFSSVKLKLRTYIFLISVSRGQIAKHYRKTLARIQAYSLAEFYNRDQLSRFGSRLAFLL